jgi:copper chaperone CopZ
MATIELAVPTVHCTACKLNIEERLEEVGGVTASTVDLGARRLTVDYDASTVAPAAIRAAVEDAGYPVA